MAKTNLKVVEQDMANMTGFTMDELDEVGRNLDFIEAVLDVVGLIQPDESKRDTFCDLTLEAEKHLKRVNEILNKKN